MLGFLEEFLKSKGYGPGLVQGVDAQLGFADFDPDTNILTNLICTHVTNVVCSFETESLKVNLYLFYSPKDLMHALKKKFSLELVFRTKRNGRNVLEQKRGLKGRFSSKLAGGFKVNYEVKDVSGWTKSSLLNLSRSLGIEIQEKTLLDEYKSEMELGLKVLTDDFIRYSVNDVVLLESVVMKMVDLVNWLSLDVLKIYKKFDANTIPMSQGALVSRVFLRYLESLLNKSWKYCFVNRRMLLAAAFCKLGFLKNPFKIRLHQFISVRIL